MNKEILPQVLELVSGLKEECITKENIYHDKEGKPCVLAAIVDKLYKGDEKLPMYMKGESILGHELGRIIIYHHVRYCNKLVSWDQLKKDVENSIRFEM